MAVLDRLFNILDKLFGVPDQEPPDFVRQLGAPIDKFSEAPDLIKRVACGLSLCAQGEYERGHALLLRDGACVEVPAYTPSGKHAYVYTELLSLAMQSLKFGSLPIVKQLAWLRGQDWILYQLIMSRAMPVKPLSCVGIVFHYMEEIRVGHAIAEPMVQAAQNAYAIQYPKLAGLNETSEKFAQDNR